MKKATLPIILALLISAPFGAKAQTSVENYVSASGFMIYHAPSYYAGADGYVFDFESDYGEGRLLDWTTIDADGDGRNWTVYSESGFGHNGSDGVLLSYSYDNYSGALHPDNFVVSPRLAITPNNRTVKFFACALDEAYPADHFGIGVSTTDNHEASAFTMLQEWTMTAKQGGWHEYTADLSDYVGQEVYLAIRHFNCSDNFCLCLDDIVIGSGEMDPLVSCAITADGVVVANDVTGIHYLLDTDGFDDGSEHSAKVEAVYQSGLALQKETAWTYRSADHFAGSPTGLQAQSDGSTVTLSWSLPENNVPFTVGELYYDFADSTLSDLTLIDANNDGRNFRVYPYGGYGGGNCLKSDSWVAGGADNVYPDNYVVTPRVTASENTRFSFMAVDCDMPGTVTDKEHFGVAVSTSSNNNPADFTMVAEWNSTGTYTEYAVDLSAYAGQQIYIAIRHFNTEGNVYYLYVDDLKVTGVEAEVTRPAKGALVYANDELIATLNHGETSFTHMVNRYTTEYCIRILQDGSRETGDYYALAAPQCAEAEVDCVAPVNLMADYDGSRVSLSWEREIYIDFEDDPDGWTYLDADGDGSVFGIYAAGGMNPDGSVNNTGSNASLTSFSYINDYGALTPDNYAFMPLVKVLPNASMTFWAAGFDANYASEHFGVAVASSDGMTINTIAEWNATHPYAKYSVDLSAYAGQEVYLGFRHFTTVANYALCIDAITVTNAVWCGTASETVRYNIYRSVDGVDYQYIGFANGDEVGYTDNTTVSVDQYYQVTAVNTIAGGDTCESAPALASDGIHDFVHVVTTGVGEAKQGVEVYPNPTESVLFVQLEGLDLHSGETLYQITNVQGQVLMEGTLREGLSAIAVENLSHGMYFITIEGTTTRFVVR